MDLFCRSAFFRPAGLALSGSLARTIVDFQFMSFERLKRITVEEGKCGGRPCIRGFRLRVSDVLDLLEGGATFEEILADYPFLEREDILAAQSNRVGEIVFRVGQVYLIKGPIPKRKS